MKYLVSIALAVALIAAAFHCMAPLPDTNHEEAFLPKASSVRYMAMGHDASVAGLFWIMGLTDLGDSYLKGKEYAYLSHVADISTSLDSLYKTPYYMVGMLTPSDSRDTTDYKIMRKALRIFPEDWRMALSFSLRLAGGPYPDKKAAADVMRPYMESTDSTMPPHLRVISRIFELDAMPMEIALEAALNDVLNPKFKKFIPSFYAKIYRTLGYNYLIKDYATDEVYQKIKKIVDDLVDEKITFQQAYADLLLIRHVETPNDSESGEGLDSLQVSADSSVQNMSADSIAQQ